MRVRTGNPYRERHGKDLRVYEFVAVGSKSPHEICEAAEAASGLRLHGDPAGQDGFINTSLTSDGSRLVSIVLYEACADASCTTGHGADARRGIPAVPHRRAFDLTSAQQAAIKVACGEHPQHKLTGNPVADAARLRALGFKDSDAPLRP